MRPSVLTKRDLETLSRVFGFASVEEFSLFLQRQVGAELEAVDA